MEIIKSSKPLNHKFAGGLFVWLQNLVILSHELAPGSILISICN